LVRDLRQRRQLWQQIARDSSSRRGASSGLLEEASHFSVFFKNFFFVAKVGIVHRKIQQKWLSSLKEGLDKYGYQSNINYK
jgi:hypothetical protein